MRGVSYDHQSGLTIVKERLLGRLVSSGTYSLSKDQLAHHVCLELQTGQGVRSGAGLSGRGWRKSSSLRMTWPSQKEMLGQDRLRVSSSKASDRTLISSKQKKRGFTSAVSPLHMHRNTDSLCSCGSV